MAKTQQKPRKLSPLTQIPVGNGGQFYKVFRVKCVPVDGKCIVVPVTPRRLQGRFRMCDETLQAPGDTARARGRLNLCHNGWHACRRKYVVDFLSGGVRAWRDGHDVVFRVALRDVHSRRGPTHRDKVVARHITMLHEVKYRSVEGRAVRKACGVFDRS